MKDGQLTVNKMELMKKFNESKIGLLQSVNITNLHLIALHFAKKSSKENGFNKKTLIFRYF